LEGEEEMANRWTELASSVLVLDAFEKGVVERLRDSGCAADGAPYAVRGMMRARLVPGLSSDKVSALAKSFLDKEGAGAYGLTEADKAKLISLQQSTASAAAQ